MPLSRRTALGFGLIGVASAASAWPASVILRKSNERQQLKMTMAPSEHRGFRITYEEIGRLASIRSSALPKGFNLELYRMDKVFLSTGEAILDPLEPIDQTKELEEADTELFLRLKVDHDAPIGHHALSIDFAVNNDPNFALGFDFVIDVVPIELPNLDDLTIQGTLWASATPEIKASFDPVRAITEMRAADFNAVALARNHKNIPRLARVALNKLGFKSVRLPAYRMLNRRDLLSPEELEEHLWATDDHLRQFEALFNRPALQERLTFKLWDEPKPVNYRNVIESYRHIRKNRPWLRLEITEEPFQELGDIADIWTINAKRIDKTPTDVPKARGENVWLYANALHTLGRQNSSMRMIGWLIWRYRLEGYHFWGVNWWGEDPWSPVPDDRRAQYKRGTLLFPSRKSAGETQSSLRLQSFRDGLQDWRWLSWLDQQADADSDVRRFTQDLREKIDYAGAVEETLDPEILHTKVVAFVMDRLGYPAN